MQSPSRFLLTAPTSGSGKTTITCAILQALYNRGIRAASFKCGPDYIDPMFHSKVIGTPAYQLDSFFMEQSALCDSLVRHSDGCRVAVLEGAMGYYDGVAGTTTKASAYEVAKLTKTPVVLIIDCKKSSVSVLATILGFLSFQKDSNIVGVILNRLSAFRYVEMKTMIEGQLHIKVYGFLPVLNEFQFESRHLGLVQAQEMEELENKLQGLAQQAEKSIDIDALLELSDSVPTLETQQVVMQKAGNPVIAVARDEAFSFYYQDNLDLLAQAGAKLMFFSPLHDKELPQDVDGILLGGGYPELYAKHLSENKTMLESIAAAIKDNIPCIAECGGFLYLCESLKDKQETEFAMVGALKAKAFPTYKLGRFGYITLTALKENLLCKKGEQIKAHEFHYWDCDDCGDGFLAEKPVRGTTWSCVHVTDTLYAGFPHLAFASNPLVAQRFVEQCESYRSERG